MLFSNFDSFLWGQGVEGVMDFFPPPSLHPSLLAQCHPDPKSRGGSLGDDGVRALSGPGKAKPRRVSDDGAFVARLMCAHTPSAPR